MPTPYETLGVSPEADDAALRRRYLELTREFSPEAAPERFAVIRRAYEQVQTAAARAEHFLFKQADDETVETIAQEATCQTTRRRFPLTDLLRTATVTRK
jgi:curved DNA-binding protein CbpA